MRAIIDRDPGDEHMDAADARRLEEELATVREELRFARLEYEQKERAPIDHRVTDEDRYMASLLRLENRVRDLAAEEKRLLALLEAE